MFVIISLNNSSISFLQKSLSSVAFRLKCSVVSFFEMDSAGILANQFITYVAVDRWKCWPDREC